MKPEDVRNDLATRARKPRKKPAPRHDLLLEPASVASSGKTDAILASITASYFLLRRGLALVAFAFPIALVLCVGTNHLQTSISAYYHFSAAAPTTYGAGTARNLFVGVLWAVGTSLVFYKGYSTKENVALDVAGVAAVLVSLFPMDWPPAADAARTMTGRVHYASAITFFLAIAFVCLYCSADTLAFLKDERRRRRFRRTYAVIGTLMIGIPVGLLAFHRLVHAEPSYAVLLIEWAGIYVFSAFWMVKSHEIKVIEDQSP